MTISPQAGGGSASPKTPRRMKSLASASHLTTFAEFSSARSQPLHGLGLSIKDLHRWIVLSSTDRTSSEEIGRIRRTRSIQSLALALPGAALGGGGDPRFYSGSGRFAGPVRRWSERPTAYQREPRRARASPYLHAGPKEIPATAIPSPRLPAAGLDRGSPQRLRRRFAGTADAEQRVRCGVTTPGRIQTANHAVIPE